MLVGYFNINHLLKSLKTKPQTLSIYLNYTSFWNKDHSLVKKKYIFKPIITVKIYLYVFTFTVGK